jgi:hypothetical protein
MRGGNLAWDLLPGIHKEKAERGIQVKTSLTVENEDRRIEEKLQDELEVLDNLRKSDTKSLTSLTLEDAGPR